MSKPRFAGDLNSESKDSRQTFGPASPVKERQDPVVLPELNATKRKPFINSKEEPGLKFLNSELGEMSLDDEPERFEESMRQLMDDQLEINNIRRKLNESRREVH